MPSSSVLTRSGLVVLALVQGSLAVWALLAPRGFYDSFPGAGRSWVAPHGPYDEHLVRDVGSLSLALVVVLVVAAASLDRRLVATAAGAFLAWSLPHFAFHLTADDVLPAVDQAGSWIGQGLTIAIAAGLLIAAVRRPQEVPA